MKSKYPKMNLKYAEAEEINELSELYIKIYDLNDTDIYMRVFKNRHGRYFDNIFF